MLKSILGFFANALGYDLVPKRLPDSQEPPQLPSDAADVPEEEEEEPLPEPVKVIYVDFKARERQPPEARDRDDDEEDDEGEGPQRYALNLEMSPRVKDRLDHLGNLSGAENVIETIQHALTLWDSAVEEVARGGKVGTYSKGGKWREISLPFASKKRR